MRNNAWIALAIAGVIIAFALSASGGGSGITTVGDCTVGDCFTLAGSGSELTFDPSNTVSYEEGRIYYDSDTNTFTAFNNEPDVALNIGEEVLVFGRNNSGVTITNGQVVYVTGAVGGLPTFGLAQADDVDTSKILAVATHDIENNANGYATTTGIVRGLDTSSFVDGEDVYLSSTVAGDFTVTRSESPNFDVFVGTILLAHPSAGLIHVDARPAESRTDCSGKREALTFNVTTEIQDCQSIATTVQVINIDNHDWTIPGWACFATPIPVGFLQNDLGFNLIVPAETTTYTLMGINVTSAGAGGTVARLGLYEANESASGYEPGALIVDAGTVDISTTGAKTLAISETLTRGRPYFTAFSHDAAALSLTLCDDTRVFTSPVSGRAQSLSANLQRVTLTTSAFGTGALPDPAPAQSTISGATVHTMVRLSE